MTLEEAIKHLLDNEWLQPDGSLYCLGTYISVDSKGSHIVLDGDSFTPQDLMAISIYVTACRE